jgi:hypothetical protein
MATQEQDEEKDATMDLEFPEHNIGGSVSIKNRKILLSKCPLSMFKKLFPPGRRQGELISFVEDETCPEP